MIDNKVQNTLSYIVHGLKVLGIFCVIQFFTSLIGCSLVDFNTVFFLGQFAAALFVSALMINKVRQSKEKVTNKVRFICTLLGLVTFLVLYYIEFRVNWIRDCAYSSNTLYGYLMHKLNTVNLVLESKYGHDSTTLHTAGKVNYIIFILQALGCTLVSYLGTGKRIKWLKRK